MTGRWSAVIMCLVWLMSNGQRIENNDQQKEKPADGSHYNLYRDDRGQVGMGVQLNNGLVLTPDGSIKQSINKERK